MTDPQPTPVPAQPPVATPATPLPVTSPAAPPATTNVNSDYQAKLAEARALLASVPPTPAVPKQPTDWQRVAAIIRQAGALAAIGAGIATDPALLNVLPSSMAVALTAVGGAILAMEHLVSPNSPKV